MEYIPISFSIIAIPFIVVAIKKARRGDGLGGHYIAGVALSLFGLALGLLSF